VDNVIEPDTQILGDSEEDLVFEKNFSFWIDEQEIYLFLRIYSPCPELCFLTKFDGFFLKLFPSEHGDKVEK
jgi:hypothetical protein